MFVSYDQIFKFDLNPCKRQNRSQTRWPEAKYLLKLLTGTLSHKLCTGEIFLLIGSKTELVPWVMAIVLSFQNFQPTFLTLFLKVATNNNQMRRWRASTERSRFKRSFDPYLSVLSIGQFYLSLYRINFNS